MSAELSIGYLFTRADGDEYDTIIYFEIDHYSPGCPTRIRYDENDHPAEAAEYEFSFIRAELDPPNLGDGTAPLTDAETAELRAWFEADGYDAAYDKAEYRREINARYGDY